MPLGATPPLGRCSHVNYSFMRLNNFSTFYSSNVPAERAEGLTATARPSPAHTHSLIHVHIAALQCRPLECTSSSPMYTRSLAMYAYAYFTLGSHSEARRVGNEKKCERLLLLLPLLPWLLQRRKKLHKYASHPISPEICVN
ncbi:unnamed protein product [Trichogramma brassicae]|uniref:Uncharacterized protein n=1 Tax=Trichogramma brassicae TaxID=86971 RepID=A0A6H5JAE0_9HYME|nr:unnamed protein product [Trichogramma brassicae]